MTFEIFKVVNHKLPEMHTLNTHFTNLRERIE